MKDLVVKAPESFAVGASSLAQNYLFAMLAWTPGNQGDYMIT
jgi:hypothetical protein